VPTASIGSTKASRRMIVLVLNPTYLGASRC
jgi:hypothetical protein